jgi:hypothetical protein
VPCVFGQAFRDDVKKGVAFIFKGARYMDLKPLQKKVTNSFETSVDAALRGRQLIISRRCTIRRQFRIGTNVLIP